MSDYKILGNSEVPIGGVIWERQTGVAGEEKGRERWWERDSQCQAEGVPSESVDIEESEKDASFLLYFFYGESYITKCCILTIFKCMLQWYWLHSVFCHHHHYPFPELFYHSIQNCIPTKQSLPVLASPQPLATSVLLSAYEFDHFRYLI